jgi:hypothetical protein
MPHNFDFDGMHESLFIVRNLCFASEPICRTNRLGRYAEASGDVTWQEYFGWLKALLSRHLIQCSITLRMIQDSLKRHVEDIDLSVLETDAANGLLLGQFRRGSGDVTIREACNKIIHATDVSLVWCSIAEEDETEYWSGAIVLEGCKGKEDWELLLNAGDLCTAISRLLSRLESEVDWYHFYKYDS